MGSLDTYSVIKNKLTVASLMEPSQDCFNYIGSIVGDDIKVLNEYNANTEEVKIEIQKAKLRKYADGYQDKESKFDQKTSSLLLSILVTNVASLVALSLFIRMDSEEIG